MFEAVAFYLFSILTIVMFLIVVFSKNALYSMSALAGGMIFIAGFFFLLDADFLGVVQIIVYTGAVMALYAFGMMFFDTTRNIKEDINTNKKDKWIYYLLVAGSTILIITVISVPFMAYNVEALYPMMEGVANPQMVGVVLFTKYLVPFELAAVMLLVAMIAGIILVSKNMDVSITLSEEFDKEFQGKEEE